MRVVNGAGPDNHQQPVVGAVDDSFHRLAGKKNLFGNAVIYRQLLNQTLSA